MLTYMWPSSKILHNQKSIYTGRSLTRGLSLSLGLSNSRRRLQEAEMLMPQTFMDSRSRQPSTSVSSPVSVTCRQHHRFMHWDIPRTREFCYHVCISCIIHMNELWDSWVFSFRQPHGTIILVYLCVKCFPENFRITDVVHSKLNRIIEYTDDWNFWNFQFAVFNVGDSESNFSFKDHRSICSCVTILYAQDMRFNLAIPHIYIHITTRYLSSIQKEGIELLCYT